MANQEHLEVLKQGTDVWNAWRKQHPEIRPDLSRANLSQATLNFADLSRANLTEANLSGVFLGNTDLTEANLTKANLSVGHLYRAKLGGANLSQATLNFADLSQAGLIDANLIDADLSRARLMSAVLMDADLSRANLMNAGLIDADFFEANLTEANLTEANLSRANLSRANLSRANLSQANLSQANLVGTNLTEATLTGCYIYGISAWDVALTGALQNGLVITPFDQPTIMVDNLKIAQFLYLLLNNQEIRDVIDTIAKKAVLILGRFTPERKAVLDALRDELRRHGYLPILFDFDKPSSRDLTETVRTLAHLSRFIVADLTDPSSIPQELYAIAPTLAVPIQPVLEATKREYSTFSDLSRTYHWILPIYRYTNLDTLLASLQGNVIDPAEQKAQELTQL